MRPSMSHRPAARQAPASRWRRAAGLGIATLLAAAGVIIPAGAGHAAVAAPTVGSVTAGLPAAVSVVAPGAKVSWLTSTNCAIVNPTSTATSNQIACKASGPATGWVRAVVSSSSGREITPITSIAIANAAGAPTLTATVPPGTCAGTKVPITVTAKSGADGIFGLTVQFKDGATVVATGVTDATGTAKLAVTPSIAGGQTVETTAAGGWSAGAAIPASVLADTTCAKSISLTTTSKSIAPDTDLTVTGTITNTAGQPITGAPSVSVKGGTVANPINVSIPAAAGTYTILIPKATLAPHTNLTLVATVTSGGKTVSSAPLAIKIVKGKSALTLDVTSPVLAGTALGLKGQVTVTGAGPAATGTVKVTLTPKVAANKIDLVCTLNGTGGFVVGSAAGPCDVDVSDVVPGTFKVTAEYLGDVRNATAKATGTIVVEGVATNVTVVARPLDEVTVGEEVPLLVGLTKASDGTPVVGDVVVTVKNGYLSATDKTTTATINVVGGENTTLKAYPAKTGVMTVLATYAGDATNGADIAVPATINVAKNVVASPTTIVASGNTNLTKAGPVEVTGSITLSGSVKRMLTLPKVSLKQTLADGRVLTVGSGKVVAAGTTGFTYTGKATVAYNGQLWAEVDGSDIALDRSSNASPEAIQVAATITLPAKMSVPGGANFTFTAKVSPPRAVNLTLVGAGGSTKITSRAGIVAWSVPAPAKGATANYSVTFAGDDFNTASTSIVTVVTGK